MPYKKLYHHRGPEDLPKLKKYKKDLPMKVFDKEENVYGSHYDTIFPDSIALVRVGPLHYRERLTGIELKGEKPKSYEWTITWEIVFPDGDSFPIGTRRSTGMQLLYYLREGVKGVLERYLVNTRGPDGRVKTFINDPNPISRGQRVRHYVRQSPTRSPSFLACI